MRLEDNEIRDITKYLEEGKSLPEKYRFFLFEEKSPPKIRRAFSFYRMEKLRARVFVDTVKRENINILRGGGVNRPIDR